MTYNTCMCGDFCWGIYYICHSSLFIMKRATTLEGYKYIYIQIRTRLLYCLELVSITVDSKNPFSNKLALIFYKLNFYVSNILFCRTRGQKIKRRLKNNRTIFSKDLLVLSILKYYSMQYIKVYKNVSFN